MHCCGRRGGDDSPQVLGSQSVRIQGRVGHELRIGLSLAGQSLLKVDPTALWRH